jgi:hypothetical protein
VLLLRSLLTPLLLLLCNKLPPLLLPSPTLASSAVAQAFLKQLVLQNTQGGPTGRPMRLTMLSSMHARLRASPRAWLDHTSGEKLLARLQPACMHTGLSGPRNHRNRSS